jgi:hypothetical protein
MIIRLNGLCSPAFRLVRNFAIDFPKVNTKERRIFPLRGESCAKFTMTVFGTGVARSLEHEVQLMSEETPPVQKAKPAVQGESLVSSR